MMSRFCPSSVPLVPSSAIMYWITWSWFLCMALQISIRFENTVFFVPSLSTCGGLMMVLVFSDNAGFFSRKMPNTRPSSSS